MPTRRVLLESSGRIAVASWLSATGRVLAADTGSDGATLETLRGKAPLIRHALRPPNYETPLAALQDALTPNDRFFVRWHLANIPQVDARQWRLSVNGAALAAARSFTLEQLRREFRPVELVAVCQCAGNQRALANPRAPGVQWGVGAVGNARWRGIRLRELLERAGCRQDSLVEVAFNGGERPVLDVTPDFIKSIPASKALDENTLIAYEMNGAPLPHWNGFPARLVVPGWAGTYWVKQLVSIEARTEPLGNFWMKSAYRVPQGKYPDTDRFPTQEADGSSPVTNIDINALITNVRPGQMVHAGRPLGLQGVAWDAGRGIRTVEIATDESGGWQAAQLGPDLGRFAFRPWRAQLVPARRGTVTVQVRATNQDGLSQPDVWIANPAGYHNNIVQQTRLEVI
ncbi:MAG: molybdopterin-dependent oxidoreductase [Sinobacteraceae bacterium]|nr:molybdopterin-dependent oxidoreductase [Nevskiaceae bacterium]